MERRPPGLDRPEGVRRLTVEQVDAACGKIGARHHAVDVLRLRVVAKHAVQGIELLLLEEGVEATARDATALGHLKVVRLDAVQSVLRHHVDRLRVGRAPCALGHDADRPRQFDQPRVRHHRIGGQVGHRVPSGEQQAALANRDERDDRLTGNAESRRGHASNSVMCVRTRIPVVRVVDMAQEPVVRSGLQSGHGKTTAESDKQSRSICTAADVLVRAVCVRPIQDFRSRISDVNLPIKLAVRKVAVLPENSRANMARRLHGVDASTACA